MARTVLSGMLLAALLAAGAGPAVAAVVYRWTDEAGRVHFGQVPPAGRPFEVLRVPGGQAGEGAPAPAATKGAPGERVPDEAGAPPSPPRNAGVSEGAGPREEDAAGRVDCERARRTLETLRARPPSRVLVRASDGTVRRMTEAEHREQLERLGRLLAERCGDR